MHKIFFSGLLLAWGMLLTISAVEIHPKNGGLVFERFSLGTICATPGWKTQIAQKNCVAAIEKKDNGKIIFCDIPFPIPGFDGSRLKQTLTQTGNLQWHLSLELHLTQPTELAGIMLNAQLSEEDFAGGILQINQRNITLPVTFQEKGKAILFYGKATEIAIAQPDSKLYLRGNFIVQLQDNRNWKHPGYSLRILFTPDRGNIERAGLELDIVEVPYSSQMLDLHSAANSSLKDTVAGDGKGGWTDQGADNDLRMLPQGTIRLGGIQFLIGTASSDSEKTCVVLGGAAREYFPRQAEAIQNKPVSGKYLSLLHALAWPSNKVIGAMRINYTDGTVKEIFLQGEKDVGNWWQPQDCPNGTVVWNNENPSSYVGLYHSIFPIEEKTIRSVSFTSSGVSVWGIVAASVHQERPPRPLDIPVYIAEGKDWKPFEYKRDIQVGSILDFSGRLDAPAGKYGPVVIRDGKFYFRDRPAMPVKFYGVNFGGNALCPNKATAERIADRIVAAGYNAVRIHNHDNVLVRRTGNSSVELDPESLDRFEYFIYCLKKRGIYLSADLYVARKTRPGEIPEFPGKSFWLTEYKSLIFSFDSVKENLKAFARNFLTHVNPYTGLALKDDPALFSLSLINEDDIFLIWNKTPESTEEFRKRFDAWKTTHKMPNESTAAADNPVFAAFLDEQYRNTFRDLRNFVRELGVAIPLTDQNMTATLRTAAMRDDYDYVDIHTYWDHPSYLGNLWNPPSKLHNRSVISATAEIPAKLMLARHLGKPMMVTEFDFSSPNMFRAEGPVVMGAYAAFQNWDGLFHYAYTHNPSEFDKNKDINGTFFCSAVDPLKYLSQIIGIRLFLDGGITAAAERLTFVLDDRKNMSFKGMPTGDAARLGLLTGVGYLPSLKGAVPGAENSKGILRLGHSESIPADGVKTFSLEEKKRSGLLNNLIKANVIDSKQFDAASNRYLSSTGQLELNGSNGTFRVFSPECEAWVLPAGRSGNGPAFRIVNQVGRGVFAAISGDRKPLKQSDRILLMHLTDTQVEKTKFSNAAKNRLERHGKGRILAARGEAVWEAELDPRATYELYSVDTSGKRLHKNAIQFRNGNQLHFSTQVFQRDKSIFLYELVKVK